jgi:hypothetical protein
MQFVRCWEFGEKIKKMCAYGKWDSHVGNIEESSIFPIFVIREKGKSISGYIG